LRLGTRASALALAQVDLTQAALKAAYPELETTVEKFVTRGDQKLDLSLIRSSEAGGKGLFTKELEEALLAGTSDVAVHSLKDLPGHLPAGLVLAAVLPRAATADVLIARAAGGLEALPQGARVGTSSVRRARQLQWLRPDLAIEEWRGNVQTRLRKLGENEGVAGIVLAQAGLDRLGFDTNSGVLESQGYTFQLSSLAEHLLPAIGQGAIALEAAADRGEVLELLRGINDEATLCAVRAERELQRLLEGDCTLPVGVRTTLREGRLSMRAILFGAEGEAPTQAEATGSAGEPEAVAREILRALRA
jgi:hydroxymethylbilane synthase